MDGFLSQLQSNFYRENVFCIADRIFDTGLIEKAGSIVDGLPASADLAEAAEKESEDGSKARHIWAPM
jgi:phytanoyl-CoA hydroxylase